MSEPNAPESGKSKPEEEGPDEARAAAETPLRALAEAEQEDGRGAPGAEDGAAGDETAEAGQAETEAETRRRRSRRCRYQVVTRDDGFRVVCAGSPNIFLRVERGLAVSEGERKKVKPQTIFLDGAYTGPPFYDNQARHYSLDHHHGCVRAFTLATCEQAVVMLLQGLPLEEGSWEVLVNDPDMDAVLASWTLLNHNELLRDDRALLRRAMPLIRVEGVIDAHGLGMELLTGFEPETFQRLKAQIDALMSQERRLKATGAWETMDWFQYSRDILAEVDALLFPEEYLDRLLEVEEVSRATLRGGKIAIHCRSGDGIYAVENQLKARYDKQLAVIVLELGPGRYTLRQVDPFLDPNLTALFKALNARDPKVGKVEGQDNFWGGSDEIGGSPRGTGSGLSGEQIMETVAEVFGEKQSWFGRLMDRWRS